MTIARKILEKTFDFIGLVVGMAIILIGIIFSLAVVFAMLGLILIGIEFILSPFIK